MTEAYLAGQRGPAQEPATEPAKTTSETTPEGDPAPESGETLQALSAEDIAENTLDDEALENWAGAMSQIDDVKCQSLDPHAVRCNHRQGGRRLRCRQHLDRA